MRIEPEAGSVLRYGGIFERGSKEYTLDDFYAVQLEKMDKYVCLKKSDVVIPEEAEEESSSDDEDDGDDDSDGEDSDDDTLVAPRQASVEVEVEFEEKEEDVSDSINCPSQGLIRGIGFAC